MGRGYTESDNNPDTRPSFRGSGREASQDSFEEPPPPSYEESESIDPSRLIQDIAKITGK